MGLEFGFRFPLEVDAKRYRHGPLARKIQNDGREITSAKAPSCDSRAASYKTESWNDLAGANFHQK